MPKAKKLVSVAIALTLTATMLAGCNPGGKQSVSKSGGAVKLPLSTPQTLKIWMPVPSAALTSKYTDFSNLPRYKEISKRTNITLQVICPPVGQEKDQFTLMVSSGSLPDIIDGTAVQNLYPGGVQKAYSDGIVVKLNDLIKKDAPDLNKIYSTYKDVDALAKDDNGNYLFVPFIRGQAQMASFSGPIVRKDWLDKLNIPVPQTIDDWYSMLTQFKTKMGATAPLLLSYGGGTAWDGAFVNNFLIGSYGVGLGWFLEDGKVKFGSADPRFKDFLTEMAKWYKEGLLDPEFSTESTKTYDAKAGSNKAGAFYGGAGGALGKYIQAMAKVDPSYKLTGVPVPTLKKGDINRFYQTGNIVNQESYITSKCKNPDLAMAFLNYGFSRDGYILYNFGIEGTSFTWQNNYPTYTSLVTKNPDGLTMGTAIQEYAFASTFGNMVQDPRYGEQYSPTQEQQDALKTWTAAQSKLTPAQSYICQGRLIADESSSIASNQTQINTYRDESMLKFITGVQPINDNTFNAYVSQLKSLGLDTVQKTMQGAEDRFNKSNPSFYKSKSFSNPYDLYKDIKK